MSILDRAIDLKCHFEAKRSLPTVWRENTNRFKQINSTILAKKQEYDHQRTCPPTQK